MKKSKRLRIPVWLASRWNRGADIACLLGLLAALYSSPSLAQNNPVPFVNQPLVPTAAAPGGPAFTLTVNGTGFVAGSVVHWNGSPRATTFVSHSQLTAAIPASDIATPGTASVTVVSSTPGGGTSNALFFFVATPESALAFRTSSLSPGPNPYAAAEGDFNGDGKLDLAILTPASSPSSLATVSIFLGNGDGTFTLKTTLSGPFSGGSPIAVGDFNGDGKLDLALLSSSSGSGAPPSTVSIYLGNGDGMFQAPLVTTVGPSPWAMAVGDFNGDGKLDLAISVSSGTIGGLYLLLGNGDGTFQPRVLYPVGTGLGSSNFVAVGDFNGDGYLDLAVGDGDMVAILLGFGDGTFGPPFPYYLLTAGPAISGAVADFNGDGILDLAVTTATANGNSVSVLLGFGDGTFEPPANFAVGADLGYIAAADLNADNKLDLAVASCGSDPTCQAPGAVTVLLGNGDGSFQSPENFSTSNRSPSGIIVGDFNGDGRADFAVPGRTGVSVLIQIPTPAVTLSSASADFGSETVSGTSSPQTVTLKNTGTTILTLTDISVTGTDSGDFALASSSTCPASGGTLQVGASCKIAITFTPTAWGSRTATLTIADNASNSPQTVDLSGMGEDFSLSLSNSTTGGTITAGGTEGYTVAISPEGGFNQTVALTCTGAPSRSTCSVSPSSVTLDGSNTANVTVSVATTAPTMAPGLLRNLPPGISLSFWLLVLSLLAVLVRRKDGRVRLVLAASLLLVVLWASCGGGGGTVHTPGTPKGTYTLTVTGTMTSSSSSAPLTHTLSLTLNVI